MRDVPITVLCTRNLIIPKLIGLTTLELFIRWTNIPEQNFNPQLDQVFSQPSIASLPLSREPFYVKYPWILQDIVVSE